MKWENFALKISHKFNILSSISKDGGKKEYILINRCLQTRFKCLIADNIRIYICLWQPEFAFFNFCAGKLYQTMARALVEAVKVTPQIGIVSVEAAKVHF